MATEQKAFQVRLPADLHARLNHRAEALGPGVSMNKLVEEAVRNLLEGGEIKLSPNAAAADARDDLVVAALEGGVGALKGIAQHYGNLGLANLSGLLYGLSAQVLSKTDPKLAAKELLRTAARLPHQRRDLAIALFRIALRYNPQYEVAQNQLGQALYFSGQTAAQHGDQEAALRNFKEAVDQLVVVRDLDNRAMLFHGRATLELARHAANRNSVTRARDEIITSLKKWAFGSSDARERSKWLRQVAELDRLGDDFHQAVDELLDYANDNTSWAPVSRELLVAAPLSPTDDAAVSGGTD